MKPLYVVANFAFKKYDSIDEYCVMSHYQDNENWSITVVLGCNRTCLLALEALNKHHSGSSKSPTNRGKYFFLHFSETL